MKTFITSHKQQIEIEPIFKSIAFNSSKYPEKPAIISGENIITYRELNDRIHIAANIFLEKGIASNSRIGIDSKIGVDLLVGTVSAMMVGGIPVLLPGKNFETCSYIVKDCQPAMLVTGTHEQYNHLAKLGVLTILLPIYKGTSNLTKNDTLSERLVNPEDIAMILYSSGTSSGVKKGVVQQYCALQKTTEYITKIMDIKPEIVEYVASPLDTAFGFGRCRVIFHMGGTVVFDDGILNPAKMLVSIKQHHCNAIAGDSAICILLLKYFKKHLEALADKFRWIKIASQPLTAGYKEMLLNMMPHAKIFMNYGLTEAMRCTINHIGAVKGKIESTGRACPGVQVMAVDDSGRAVPHSHVGEIKVKGVNLAYGYWGKKELWNAVCRDGWFHTGDLGYIDGDGYLYIVGRKDDLVNIGGRKVAPDEVEELIAPHLPQIQFAVCGIKDSENPLGEILALCIENEISIDLKKLRDLLIGKVEEYKIPNKVFHIQKLPRTENGKVQRRQLKELISI